MAQKNDGDEHSGERVAKTIARAGLTSRREAEQWIAAGRVAVNGEVIQSPARNVTARDRISVDGEPLPTRERTRLFLYNKPRGLVTTHADPRERPTIFASLPKHLPRLISVGRLDFNTEGLLLLTNDGGLARILELPATGWLRRYRVRAHGTVTQQKLDDLRAGVTVDGIRYGEIEATLDRVQGSNLWLTFAIREGKNREVRNVLGHVGLTVTRLIRVSFGPFQLNELAEGDVEEVSTRVLREQLGERVIALSGADFSGPAANPDRAKPNESGYEHPKQDRPRQEQSRQVGARQERPRQERPRQERLKHDRAPARDDRYRRPELPSKTAAKDERPKRQPKSPPPAHSWRASAAELPGKKLRRKFRGSRRDDEKRPERSPDKPRAGLLTDRKGRRIFVERFARARTPEQLESRPPEKTPDKAPKNARQSRRRSPDRASGARPRSPRKD